jgi:hypothetical protein
VNKCNPLREFCLFDVIRDMRQSKMGCPLLRAGSSLSLHRCFRVLALSRSELLAPAYYRWNHTVPPVKFFRKPSKERINASYAGHNILCPYST